MKRALLALALLAGLALGTDPALAQNGWAGLVYPNGSTGNTIGTCQTEISTTCTSYSATWAHPTVTWDAAAGGNQGVYAWIGSIGNFSLTSDLLNCPGTACLGQMGSAAFVATSGTHTDFVWFELFCPNGGSSSPVACTPVVQMTNFTVSAGDRLQATMTCVSTCTPGSLSQKWSLVMQDLTTAATCNMSPATVSGGFATCVATVCTDGSQSSCFAWPLDVANAIAVIEPNGPQPYPTIAGGGVRFSDWKVNGSPTPQFKSMSRAIQTLNQGSKTSFPSFYDPLRGQFNVCVASGTYSAATKYCPAPTYGGGSGDALE